MRLMTEIEAEREMTRTEVADYLREFAAQLDTSEAVSESRSPHERDGDDHRVTFMVGSDSATIDPPETVTFEVEVESDSSLVGSGVEHEVEFELAWQTEATDESEDEAELEIE